MAKQTEKRKLVVDMTAQRVADVEARGYDIVPLSVLQQPPDEVYPRLEVDTDVVEQYRENWDSYETSPIDAELTSGFILDGVHRYTACKEIGEIQAKANNEEFDASKVMIRVNWVETPSSAAEFLLSGASKNSKHGHSLNNDDRKKCVIWLNRNARPRREVTKWQEEIAQQLGVTSRTLREWINTDVADEKAHREAQIRTKFTENDKLPEDSKDRLSIQQIADIIGTTKNVVRTVRAKMNKEAKAAPTPTPAPVRTDSAGKPIPYDRTIDGQLAGTHAVVAGRGPVKGIDDMDDVSPMDRNHAIYDSSETRVQFAAMMALEEDQADSVYHDWCITVAVPDQENVREIDKSIEANPGNDALVEVRKGLDEKAEASWMFIITLCKARQTLKTNMQKWVKREARALRREMTIEETIGSGQNPHETQRVHVAMQNAPLGDEAEKVADGEKFCIFRNPLAPDGFIVGPCDTTTFLRFYYPIVGQNARTKASIIHQGFIDNPTAYDEYVATVVNRPLPNLLKGEHPGKGWLPGQEGEQVEQTPAALDPKSGEMGGAQRQGMSVDDMFEFLDVKFGAWNAGTNSYKRDRLGNLIVAQIMYWLQRDSTLELDELYELFNDKMNELLEVNNEDEEQDAIENAGETETQTVTGDDVGSVEDLGIF